MTTYSAQSTVLGSITRGKFWNLLTPWRIDVDIEKSRVHIEKKNWYLIGKDEETFQFTSVRRVKIDRSLFGADLHIRMYAGSASVFGISKRSAKAIATMLLDVQATRERRQGSGPEADLERTNDEY